MDLYPERGAMTLYYCMTGATKINFKSCKPPELVLQEVLVKQAIEKPTLHSGNKAEKTPQRIHLLSTFILYNFD